MNQSITYNYHDENQNPLYAKTRITHEDGSKSYFWTRNENGTQINNITGCRKVLYKLPIVQFALNEGLTIFLVEGEKDAEALLSRATVATTAPGSLEWPDEFTQVLKDADLVILYDNDKTGLQRKELLCKRLYGKVKRLRVADLPGLEYRDKHGLDISDWFNMGNTIEQLLELVKHTPDYTPPHNKTGLIAVNFKDFVNLEIPKPDILISPFLWSQGLVLLYAKRGVGKTHMALGIACTVAKGGTFLKWTTEQPKKVLYIDGEMSAYSMQDRLRKFNFNDEEAELLSRNLLLITPDLQETSMPNLSTPKGRSTLEQIIADRDLIIFDNLSSLFQSSSENDADDWMPIQQWALELRRQGKATLLVHHAGKNGMQRGTSKREDILDVIINLRHPENYNARDGACFEVHFEKTRHFSGDDARPFQAQLIVNQYGQADWSICEIGTDPEVKQIAEMRKEGKTYVEIMQKTGLSKSQVETRINKAKESGFFET